MRRVSSMTPDEIREARKKLGLSQKAFARELGVSFATVNRWEGGHSDPQPDRLGRIKGLIAGKLYVTASLPDRAFVEGASTPPAIDFEGDAERLKLVVDAYRLRNGHTRNK